MTNNIWQDWVKENHIEVYEHWINYADKFEYAICLKYFGSAVQIVSCLDGYEVKEILTTARRYMRRNKNLSLRLALMQAKQTVQSYDDILNAYPYIHRERRKTWLTYGGKREDALKSEWELKVKYAENTPSKILGSI
jgi:hypothetical protein